MHVKEFPVKRIHVNQGLGCTSFIEKGWMDKKTASWWEKFENK